MKKIEESENVNNKNWIGNLSIIIAFIAMIFPLIFSMFDFLPSIKVLAGIAAISLFLGKILNPKNDFLTVFIVLSIIFYFIPVYIIWSMCNNCSWIGVFYV